jgi:membrane protein YdbS with pleckstrin-like domain
MVCPHCSAETDDQAQFCPQCGGRIDLEREEPTTAREEFVRAAVSRREETPDEERTLWEGSYSRWAMFGAWASAGVATLLVVIAAVVMAPAFPAVMIGGGLVLVGWLALLAYYAYRRYSVHYQLTTQRFIHQRGLLWRRTDRIELIDVDDVTFTQGPMERMFGVGTIRITSSDKTDPEIDLPGIDNVGEVAGQIDDLRRRERRRRGLHIEAV